MPNNSQIASHVLTEQAYWDDYWQKKPTHCTYDSNEIWFGDLFAQYVKPGMHCFEVGCFPGRYMIYLYLLNKPGEKPGTSSTSHFCHDRVN